MALATATADGVPSSRMVLLKEISQGGFVFYTNYESRKGLELAKNARAAMTFYWKTLQRQVRIEGRITRVSREESEAYFHSRPRGSQAGAWASRQDAIIDSRETLIAKLQEIEKSYEGKEIPLPPWWGGFRLLPLVIEFWTGQPSRLHDRFRFTRDEPGVAWRIDRLSP